MSDLYLPLFIIRLAYNYMIQLKKNRAAYPVLKCEKTVLFCWDENQRIPTKSD